MRDNPALAATQPLVSRIVSSYVRKNYVPLADMAAVINTVHQSLIALGKAPEPKPTQVPAVSLRQSVRPSYVVCLECGARGKMLRKHLRQTHGLSPAQYRLKWGLSQNHPITAPAYSKQRSALAKEIGLGRRATRRRRRRQTKKSA
jgi:predicted transcriptional regulator